MICINVKETLLYLAKHADVYLLRQEELRQGIHVLMSSNWGKPYKIGKVNIELVAELVPYTVRTEIDDDGNESPCQERRNFNDALRSLALKSGFTNVEHWINNLRPHHREKHYLYHVIGISAGP